ncbi:MAG: c-type cytochrome [Burkholderiales bacterium]
MNWFKTACVRSVTFALAVVTVGVMTSVLLASPAMAQHKMNETDMEVPIDDMAVVEMGKGMFAQRCAFCHGGDGHGGKGPCLTCGKTHYIGNTNAELYATIAGGLPNRSLGGTMGAFGTTMTGEQIFSVVTFIRWETRRRIADGEIPDPAKDKSNDQLVFPE